MASSYQDRTIRRYLQLAASAVLLTLGSHSTVAASQSANYVLSTHSFNSGGSLAQSDQYRALGSVGRGFTPARTDSDSYSLWSGFIPQVASLMYDPYTERRRRIYLYFRAIQSSL